MWNIFKRRSKPLSDTASEPDPSSTNNEPVAAPREHAPYWYEMAEPILTCGRLPKATVHALVPTPIRWTQDVGIYSDEELSRWGIDVEHHPEFQSLREWQQKNPERIARRRRLGIPRSHEDLRRWAFYSLPIDREFVFSLFPALPRWNDLSRYSGFHGPEHAYRFVNSQRCDASSDDVHAVIAFFEGLGLSAFGRPIPAPPSALGDETITWILLHSPNPFSVRERNPDVRLRWPTLLDLRTELLQAGSDAMAAPDRAKWRLKLAEYGLLEDFRLPSRPQWLPPAPPVLPAGMPIAHAVPIVDCLLDSRLMNGAIAAGYWWLGDLMQLEAREILALPGVGKKTAYAFCDDRHSTRIRLNLRSNRSRIQHVSAILAAVRAGEKDDASAYKELAELFGSS